MVGEVRTADKFVAAEWTAHGCATARACGARAGMQIGVSHLALGRFSPEQIDLKLVGALGRSSKIEHATRRRGPIQQGALRHNSQSFRCQAVSSARTLSGRRFQVYFPFKLDQNFVRACPGLLALEFGTRSMAIYDF